MWMKASGLMDSIIPALKQLRQQQGHPEVKGEGWGEESAVVTQDSCSR